MTQFLPPNLLALFAPREPLPFLPPISKLPHERRRIPYSGIGIFSKFFDHPKDIPPPVKQETKAEKRERNRKEKAEQMTYIIEQGIALWQPHSNPRATSDPYKTLFVARINYDTSESKLKKEFSEFGTVKKLYLIFNKLDDKPRGYAFIEFEHERDMHAAYKRADGRKIDGRRVVVDVERGRTVKGWLPRRFGGGLGNSRKAVDAAKDTSRQGSRERGRKSRSRSKRRRSRSGSRGRGDKRRNSPPRRDRDSKIVIKPENVEIKKEKIEGDGEDFANKKVKKEKRNKRSRSRSKDRKHRSKSRDKDKSSKKEHRHRDKDKSSRRRDRSNDRDRKGADGEFGGFPPIKKEKVDPGYDKYANEYNAQGSYGMNAGNDMNNNNDGTVDSLEQYYYTNNNNLGVGGGPDEMGMNNNVKDMNNNINNNNDMAQQNNYMHSLYPQSQQ